MIIDKNYLQDQFQEQLCNLYTEEKQWIKSIQLLATRAESAQLRKALSLQETGGDVHLDRLSQLLKRMKLKKTGQASSLTSTLAETAKTAAGRKNTASLEKDWLILSCAKQIQHQRMATFQLLHQMSMALNLDFEATLLKQTLADHQNTDAYLSQIAQNVLLEIEV